jgi:hypothetical protein
MTLPVIVSVPAFSVEVLPAQDEKFRAAQAGSDEHSDGVHQVVLRAQFGCLQLDEKIAQLVGSQGHCTLGLALGPHGLHIPHWIGVDDIGHHRKL